MSPLSWPVLVAATLLGSPALWAAYVDDTLPPDVAMLRLGLCLLGSWVALSVFAALVGPDDAEAPDMQRPADVDLE